MNFKGLLKRAENVDKEFRELENDLAEAFDDCLNLDEQPQLEYANVSEEYLAADNDMSQP
jgi:hypothetical protein